MGGCCSKPFNVGDRITLVDPTDNSIQPATVLSASSNKIKIRFAKYNEAAFDEVIPESEWEARQVQLADVEEKKLPKQSVDASDAARVVDISDHKFKVGDTIKVQDLSHPKKKFSMARVIKVNRNSIKIHWIGEQDDFDEIIKKNDNYSNRILIPDETELESLHTKTISKVEDHFNVKKDDDIKCLDVDLTNYKFTQGQKIKCRDLSHPIKQYADASVVQIKKKSIKIHWTGEQAEFDEWVKKEDYEFRIKVVDESALPKEEEKKVDELYKPVDESAGDINVDWTQFEFKTGQKIKCRDLSHPQKRFNDAIIVKVGKKDIKIHWIGEQDNFDEVIKKVDLKGRIKLVPQEDDENDENEIAPGQESAYPALGNSQEVMANEGEGAEGGEGEGQ